jgi:hypothetical protein
MAEPFTGDSTGTTTPEMVLGWFSHGTLPGVQTLAFLQERTASGFDIQFAGTNLETILFPRLLSIDENNVSGGAAVFTINGNDALESVYVPWLTTSYAPLVITNNGSLTRVDLPVWEPIDGQVVTFSTNALSAFTVNQVLADCVANGSYATGAVHLEGGLNSPPTGQGILDSGTLTGRGVSVFHN